MENGFDVGDRTRLCRDQKEARTEAVLLPLVPLDCFVDRPLGILNGIGFGRRGAGSRPRGIKKDSPFPA